MRQTPVTSTVSCNASCAHRPGSLPRRAGGASSTRRGGGPERGGFQNVEDRGSPHPYPVPTRGRGIRAALLAAVLALLAGLAATPLAAQPLAVEVTNTSEPVLCAEKDNVTINLTSRDVRSFRIEAAHPAYIGTIQRDSFEADWTGCTAPGDPTPGTPQPPRRTTLYEQIDFWVVGLTFQSFWRPATTTVRIGNRVEKGIHLLQVWMIRPM